MPTPHALPAEAVVHVAEHLGLVGSVVTARCRRGHEVLGHSSTELDLRDRAAVDALFDEQRPAHVALAAAKAGEFLSHSTAAADFLSDNLRIQVNISPLAVP